MIYTLGSLTLFFLIYFIKLFTAIIFRLIYICYKNKFFLRIITTLENSIYYNEILGLFIDGYMDLIITGYLNQKRLKFNTKGEIFGSYFSYFALYTCITLIPFLQIWIALKKEKHLKKI